MAPSFTLFVTLIHLPFFPVSPPVSSHFQVIAPAPCAHLHGSLSINPERSRSSFNRPFLILFPPPVPLSISFHHTVFLSPPQCSIFLLPCLCPLCFFQAISEFHQFFRPILFFFFGAFHSFRQYFSSKTKKKVEALRVRVLWGGEMKVGKEHGRK